MSEPIEPPRIYGTPEQRREPPPTEGLRGENATPLAEPPAEQAHAVVAEGRPITVVETSGTAFVEATGKAGHDEKDGRPSPTGTLD